MFVGRLFSLMVWDGCLPVLAILAPWIFRVFMGADEAAILSVAIVLPVFALLRCTVAYRRQLAAICGGRASAWRQFVMGMAIIVLMLFEGLFNVIQGPNQAPLPAEVMIAAAAFYFLYLALVWLALWRPEAAQPETFDEGVDYPRATILSAEPWSDSRE